MSSEILANENRNILLGKGKNGKKISLSPKIFRK